MRILLITNHFYPEEFRCNDLAFELTKCGHEVSVLTGIPDYPKGKFHKGYGIFRKRIENVQGVKIYRSFIIPRGKGGALRLMLNYISSFFAQCWDALWLGLFGRYDYVLVHETSPVMVGVPGVIVSKMKRIPMDFWVLDLWPESLQAAGGINNRWILGCFESLTTWIYRNSDKILISSKGFEQSIMEKGDFGSKLIYFPNWADKALNKVEKYNIPELPDGFIVMFAGNMGEAQDFDHIMEAASMLQHEKDIHFVFVGDGRKRPWVESFMDEHNLHDTVHWVGRHPIEAMPSFFERADVMLMTLKDIGIFNLTAPAKLQAYMSAAKPILAMMNGEGPRIIDEAQCGMSVAAGDSKGLADTILQLSKMDKTALVKMGENGKLFQKAHFDLDKSISHLCEIMETRSYLSKDAYVSPSFQ